MGIKVLFIYPNTYGMNMLPPAIALFSSLLKNAGHQVDIFDATYYQTDYGIDSDGTKADRLNVVPFDPNEHGIKMRTSHWRDDLVDKVGSFRPDLIAISSTEDMWDLGIMLLESVEEYIDRNRVPVIAGGVFPTFAPHLAIRHRLINMVCVGEGENALLDLCARLEKGEPYDNVTNLWVKKNHTTITKNPMSRPVDINRNPVIDVSIFEEARLYRPMAGKWYKMMPVETIRGCPYRCAFCNSPNQVQLYKSKLDAKFLRKKRIDLVYNELKHFKEELGIQYNYFWADTFLAMNNNEFDEFCDMYEDIRLPFWMQTRPETLTDYKVRRLAEVGLHRISFGLEHGNEEFRSRMLRRDFKNEDIIEALKIPGRYGVQYSANNITGFPMETRELAMDTVELNRNISSDNQNIYSFVPFHGTPLRKVCEDMGLIDSDTLTKCLTDEPQIRMSQYPPEEIAGLQKCFALYVKFPRSRWKDIRKAEANTVEGEKIFSELREEYLERYMPGKGNRNNREIPQTADLEYGMPDIAENRMNGLPGNRQD